MELKKLVIVNYYYIIKINFKEAQKYYKSNIIENCLYQVIEICFVCVLIAEKLKNNDLTKLDTFLLNLDKTLVLPPTF